MSQISYREPYNQKKLCINLSPFLISENVWFWYVLKYNAKDGRDKIWRCKINRYIDR